MIMPVKPATRSTQAEKPVALVQLAPKRFVQLELKIEGKAPETVFCDLEEAQGHPGYYRLVPRSLEYLVRVTPELVEKLGLEYSRRPNGGGNGCTTLKRLIRAGFVDGARVSPQVYTVNLASYFQHLKRCAEDPDFWENPKVRKVYNSAYL